MRHLLAALAVATLSCPAFGQGSKLPRPSESSYEAIASKLNASISADNRTAELVSLAKNESLSGEERYVVLSELRTTAAESGNVAAWIGAVRALRLGFEAKQQDYFRSDIDALLKGNPRAFLEDELVEWVVADAILQSLNSEGLATARRLKGYKRRTMSNEARMTIDDTAERCEKLATEQELAKRAKERLKSEPTNRKAHEAIGKWIALQEGNWQLALVHLAKSDNRAVRSVAQLEIEKPNNLQVPTKWMELAFAENADANDNFRISVLNHCVNLFEAHREKVDSALDKKLIENSVSKIEAALRRLGPVKNLIGVRSTEVPMDPCDVALDFSVTAMVSTGVRYDGTTPITIEAWVTLVGTEGCIVENSHRLRGLRLNCLEDGSLAFVVRGKTSQKFQATIRAGSVRIGELAHVACIYDLSEARIYLNGKKTSTIDVSHGASTAAFNLGNCQDLIHSFRICADAVYQEDFVPARRLENLDSTLILLQLDEGSGAVVHDESRFGHDLQLNTPKWVVVQAPKGLNASSGDLPLEPEASKTTTNVRKGEPEDTNAVVSVISGSQAFSDFKNGVRAFTNRPYKWHGIKDDVPFSSFSACAGGGKEPIRFMVSEAGMVFVAINEKSDAVAFLRRNGWLPTEHQFHYGGSTNNAVRVFTRILPVGSYSIPRITFAGPSLLNPWPLEEE